ncbi:MAG: response regulator [Verrucomicrobia bacterium]|nr:response regulator [Verrucomicrobiota bacterium]
MNNPQSILVVDDDAEMLKALTFALEKEGYAVTGQPSADSALSSLRGDTPRFDLVITDIAMPGMTGLPFLTALKKAFPAMPVILITAYGDWEQYRNALGEGAFEFLCKPIDKTQLLACVRRALGGEPPAPSATPPWDAF